MIAVPGVMPLTVPEESPTVATPVALLLQVPPGTLEDRVADADVQILVVPVIVPADGVALTVAIAVVLQPVGNV